MKTLVNSPIEKNIVVDKSPLWRRISAEQLYGLLSLISPHIGFTYLAIYLLFTNFPDSNFSAARNGLECIYWIIAEW